MSHCSTARSTSFVIITAIALLLSGCDRADKDAAAPPVANAAPKISAGTDTVAYLQYDTALATASLAGTISDDGLPTPAKLTVAWSKVSGPGNAVFSAGNAATSSVTFDALGAYVLKLSASDGVLSNSADVRIAVQAPVNKGPKFSPLANRNQGVGYPLSFKLIASDTNPNDTLTYLAVSVPAGATVSAQGIVHWTPSAAQLGPQTFQVAVHDASGMSDTQSFIVTVGNQNHAPTLGVLTADVASVGANYRKTINGNDVDGNALTFDLVAGPTGMTLTGTTLQWVPSMAQTGDSSVKVRVRDTAGASAVGLFKITVNPINVAGLPFAANDDFTVKVGELLNVAAPGVLGNDYDPSGGKLTAIKRSSPSLGTLSAFGADGSFSFQAPAVDPRPPFAIIGRPITSSTANLRTMNELIPLLIDVNHDGLPDLIYFGFSGPTSVATALSGGDGHTLFDAAGGLEAGGCENNLASDPGYVAGDIDDDGQVELVTVSSCRGVDADNYNRLAAFRSDGSLKWRSASATKPFLELQCSYGNNSCPPQPTLVAFPMLRSSLSLVRLAPNEKPVILTRQEIPANAGDVYNEITPGNFGHKYYGCRLATGLVADMGQACNVTLILSTTDGSVLQVLRAPIRPQFNRGIPIAPYYRNPPIAADLDGDGQVEIISGADVWKRVNGQWTLAWQSDAEPEQVAVADLDGDGHPKIIQVLDRVQNLPAGTPYLGFTGILVFDANGTELKRIPLPTSFPGLLTIADVDGDHVPEFLITEGGNLHVINTDGSFKWSYAVPGHSVFNVAPYGRTSYHGNVVVYDLDGDGNNEVIFSSSTGLHILDGRTGAEKAFFDGGTRDGGINGANTTFVTDWNNDGHAHIVSVAGAGYNIAPAAGGVVDPFAYIISAKNNDWLPASKIHNQVAFQPSSVDETGHVLYDASVQRSYRNQVQLGTVRDPRTTSGTSFDYVANNGTADSAVAKVFVKIAPKNSPPVFTSRPPLAIQAQGPSPFVYQAAALDPDAGDTITYSLTAFAPGTNLGGPAYFSIDAKTGAVSLPRNPGFGPFNMLISITATDSFGASAVQTFVVAHQTAAPVAVPNVVGKALSAAVPLLANVLLHPTVLQQEFSTQSAGTVIAQNPLGASIQPIGSEVLLTVSKGPATVIVPGVVGKFETDATTLLQGAGFTVTTLRSFSTSDSGVVLSQSLAAGSQATPGTITLGVSSGSGLSLRLSRSVTPSNEPIPFILVATDINGHVIGAPTVTTSIAPVSAASGALPSAGGTTISTAIDTRGRYRLTVTAGTVTSSAEFVVTQPNTAAAPTQLEYFAKFDQTLVTMDQLLAEANVARLANDSATMSAKMIAWVNTWRAVDIEALSLAVPVVPENGFPPEVLDLVGFGVTQSPDDVLNKTILSDASDDLLAIQLALREPTTPYPQIHDLFRSFNARAERIRAVSPGEYGVIDAKALYAELLAHRVPQVMDALVEDIARVFALPARKPFFPGLVQNAPSGAGALDPRGEIYVCSTLGEQLATLAVQQVVDAIGGGYTLKKFYQAAFVSAAGAGLVVAAAQHIRSLPGVQDLTVTTGASISINIFGAPYSTLEGIGVNGNAPAQNTVMMVGPELYNSFRDALDKILGLGGLVTQGKNLVKAKNLDDINQGLEEFKKKAKEQEGILQTAADRIARELAKVYQTPSPRAAVSDCLFTPGPLCSSVQYLDGFDSVYGTLGLNLATPILFVVVNNLTGATLVASPAFLPAPP